MQPEQPFMLGRWDRGPRGILAPSVSKMPSMVGMREETPCRASQGCQRCLSTALSPGP